MYISVENYFDIYIQWVTNNSYPGLHICTITHVTFFYQQLGNGNIAKQIHKFTIHYSKIILNKKGSN